MADLSPSESPQPSASEENTIPPNTDMLCPVCGGPLISEKCKVVCRSERCRYRIVFNCAEF
jgi:hypothetical protein